MGTRPKSPSFFWETSSSFCQIQPYVFCPVPSGGGNARRCRSSAPRCTLGRRRCTKVLPKGAVLHPRATKMYESVAQGSRAAPSGDDKARKRCPREPCCTLGRRRCTKVLPKRAVLHPWTTIKYESVAQESRAVPSGDDKCGFRCRRVSFIHTSFCPAPLGNGKARKSRLTVPRVTFGCGTVRRHRSRRARRRPLLLSLEGFRGVGRMVVRPLYRPLYPAYSFDIWKFLLFLS